MLTSCQIAHTDFPVTHLPLPSSSIPPSSPPQIESQSEPASQPESIPGQDVTISSQSANKENSPPTPRNLSATLVDTPPGTLPPQFLALLTTIIENLKTYFSKYPPHTIQRLSELILSPKEHYRTLPAYLHALDRVVHVTSGANIYPLPPAVPDALGAKVLSNGISTGTDPNSVSWGNPATQPGLGSDESLGGALLTPITWIKNHSVAHGNGVGHMKPDMEGEVKIESTETIDGPNGAGGIETVSVSVNGISSTVLGSTSSAENTGLRAEGGVTQGELLRQEQRAGVVPATQLAPVRVPNEDGRGEEDETPHARGPEEIGMEDMGPQAAGSVGLAMHGIDVAAAVGRRVGARVDVAPESEDDEEPPTTPKREAEEDLEGANKKVKQDDTDIEIVDADGRTENEAKYGEKGESKGSDAIDTSAV